MKDYLYEALKADLTVYTLPKQDIIKNYRLNKERNHIYIRYMNDREGILSITEKDNIKKLQEEQFKIIKTDINQRIKIKLETEYLTIGGHVLISVINFVMGNFLGGYFFLGLGITRIQAIKGPYKLRKDLQYTSWICENKDEINEMIKEEVQDSMQTQNIDYESLPYPKEIIEEGVSINNVDLLQPKHLRKIKRKMKKSR